MSVQRRLGDVLLLDLDPVDVNPDAEYPLAGVYSFGRGLFARGPLAGSETSYGSLNRLHARQLVVSRLKAFEGALAVVPEEFEGWHLSHEFPTFRCAEGELHPGYLAHLCRWPALWSMLARTSRGIGARRERVHVEQLLDLSVPVPPIEEQRRVAAHLDRTRTRSDRLSSALADHPSDGMVRRLPDLIDAVLNRHAHGRATVGELVDFVSDTVHPGVDPSPADRFVGLQHVASHTGLRLGSDALGPMKGRKFRFRPGDILYGYLRPYLNKAWVADCDGLCSVDQYVLRPRPGVNGDVLGHALRGRRVLSAAVDLTHSLQLPRLRSGLLAALEVPTVESFDAERVASRLSTVRDLMVDVARARTHQSELASAFLPSAMNQAFSDLT